MKDVGERFLFVIWITCGISMFLSVATNNKNMAFAFAVLFVAPVVLGIIYHIIKWIITGDE